MYEHRAAELQNFIMAISDPKVRPFIDLKKLCQSGIYNLAVQMATEHAIQHGDFCYLQKILIVLDGSIHIKGFIASLRPKLNFIIVDAKPRYFKKATPEQVAETDKHAQNKQAANTTANSSRSIAKRAAKAIVKSAATANVSKPITMRAAKKLVKSATSANASKSMTLRAAKELIKSSTTVTPKKKKTKVLKVSHDIMDSRLMLPGSYGTGRRR
jgi:hypothetical protein